MEIGLLIGIPLTTALILLVSGRSLTPIAGLLGCIATASGLVISIMAAGKDLALVYPWVSGKMFRLDLALSTGALTAFMLPLVHGIALLVQCYSIGYMKDD